MGALIKELGEEGLEERMQSATQAPARPPHRLAQAIAETAPTGRPVLVLELARGPGADDSTQLGALAAAALRAGADALCVKTDSDDTPEPLKGAHGVGGRRDAGGWLIDGAAPMRAAYIRGATSPRTGCLHCIPHAADLMAATSAAAAAGPRRDAGFLGAASSLPAPVLQRDYFIHPLQLVTAKEAGAAGVVGTIGARAHAYSSTAGRGVGRPARWPYLLAHPTPCCAFLRVTQPA